MTVLEQIAHAKINLSLEVISRRDDGYHDIASVMQLVELHDTLAFEPAERLTVETDDPVLAADRESNLVWRAANALRQATGESRGARITLEKGIPVAAGLGGGSSDAAATLLGLSQLWGMDLSRDHLIQVASGIGSDVPFFMAGPTALVEGRGERVTKIPVPPPAWVVLICQAHDVPDKTKRLYGALRKQDMTGGILTHQLLSALVRGEFPASNLLHNAFERPAFTIFEGLETACRRVHRISGRDAHLSGSGPTLFVLYPEREGLLATRLHETLQAEGVKTFLTRTVSQ